MPSDSGGTTRLIQMRPAAEAAHALSGNRVRNASGAQVMNASSTSRPALWWLRAAAFWSASCELVMAKQISAVITSATSKRSNRPIRCQRARGVGGLVVSVTNVAAKLRTSFMFMPPA